MTNEICRCGIKPVIAWGAGYYYSVLKVFLNKMGIDYIYDIKWEDSALSSYDEIPIIRPAEIKKLDKCVIVICIYDLEMANELKTRLENEFKNAVIFLLRDLSPIGRNIDGEEILLNSCDNEYVDHCGNKIQFKTEKSLKNLKVRFNGDNALISIGENMRIVNSLYIECGNESKVCIGKDTSFDKTIIYSAYGNVIIGQDCMFSYDVYLRTHDSHFIFEKQTGNRINYGKDLEIKDHVWVGQNSILLPGFAIGKDSVVGAGSVTSSKFPENIIIGGNPARIIRENVIWDRKTTWINNYDNISEIVRE